MHHDIARVLYDEASLSHRVGELADAITEDYRGKDFTVIAVLDGSLLFMADLLRRIPLSLQIKTWEVSSYHGSASSGEVVVHSVSDPFVSGRHVLLVDDILDTGATLAALRERLEDSGALSVKICVLLRKGLSTSIQTQADYIGFDIPNEFVVGYGLDYNGLYRNLPFIAVLKPEIFGAA